MNNADYMEMIEVPINSTSVKVKQSPKKRKTVKKLNKLEVEKEKLVNKINEEMEEKIVAKVEEVVDETLEKVEEENIAKEFNEVVESTTVVKKKRKLSIIGIELALIAVLICTIVFSNLFFEKTFINTFFFEKSESLLSDEDYSNFKVTLPYTESSMTVSDTGLLIEETGSVYAPTFGIISNVIEDAGKYIIEITHSNSFKTVLSGVDHAYFGINEEVFSNIPIGYSYGEGVSLCFYDNGKVITNYDIENSGVVWLV
ncbi:MAG: hypothetical protein IKC71_04355 [Clostridia bacterium]|nr:hypothetical protein [Clostridia bacterium]